MKRLLVLLLVTLGLTVSTGCGVVEQKNFNDEVNAILTNQVLTTQKTCKVTDEEIKAIQKVIKLYGYDAEVTTLPGIINPGDEFTIYLKLSKLGEDGKAVIKSEVKLMRGKAKQVEKSNTETKQ